MVSTQQITKAMKMVAAAKLRKSQERIMQMRPFAQKFLVSIVAIRIRLQRLGLLRREVPRQRTLGVGVRPPLLKRMLSVN